MAKPNRKKEVFCPTIDDDNVTNAVPPSLAEQHNKIADLKKAEKKNEDSSRLHKQKLISQGGQKIVSANETAGVSESTAYQQDALPGCSFVKSKLLEQKVDSKSKMPKIAKVCKPLILAYYLLNYS